MMRALLAATAAGFLGSSALAQSGDPIVTISVEADRDHTRAHVIEIIPASARPARSQGEVKGRRWFATRLFGDQTQTITSEDCPALRPLALSFADLPPIELRPDSLEVSAEAMPIAPTIKDGFMTTLRFRTLTADGSRAVVEVRGGNAYQAWGHRAVSDLIGCWGSLAP